MQRPLFAIIFVFIFTSCDFFSIEKMSMKNSMNSMDTIVDFSTIDLYPVFQKCESLDGEINHESCFGDELIAQLEEQILIEKVKGPETFYDTIYIDLLVDKQNKIKVIKINSSTILKEKIPKLDSVLLASVDQLPMLSQPAFKRGIPVRSQFKLPVLIRTKN